MELELVTTERRTLRRGDAEIYYTEILPMDLDRIYQDHMRRKGKHYRSDGVAVMREVLGRHVLGWKGVTLKGAEAEYSLDLLLQARGLGDELWSLITTGKPLPSQQEDEGDEGNPPTPSQT